MKAEYVGLVLSLDGTQLDPLHDPDADALAFGVRFGQSSEGVVIGQRDRGQACRLCGTNDIGGRARTVRSRRVCMEVDELVSRTAGRHARPGHDV